MKCICTSSATLGPVFGKQTRHDSSSVKHFSVDLLRARLRHQNNFCFDHRAALHVGPPETRTFHTHICVGIMSTKRLEFRSVWVLTCLWLRGSIIRPQKELHSRLWVGPWACFWALRGPSPLFTVADSYQHLLHCGSVPG